MSAVATAIAGSAVVGGYLSYKSSKNQEKAAGKSSDAQAQVQWDMYDQSREDLAPWRQAGERSLEDLERLQGTYEDVIMDPSKYIESPSYNFLLNRGVGAIDAAASASGGLDKGARSKDLMAYGQGLASQDYGNYVSLLGNLLNRYAGTAGVGQAATNTMVGLGQNTANQVGNAEAAGYINQSNARTGMYENFANIGSNATNQFMLNNYLQPQAARGTVRPQLGYQTYSGGGQSAGFK